MIAPRGLCFAPVALALTLAPPLASPALLTPAGAQGQAVSTVREALLDPEHPAWSVRAPDLFRARFRTSEGDFVLEAHRRWAPVGADRLYNLVRLGFYDDQRIFRVRAGFIAQFGLSGDPAVNAAWYGRTMRDDPPRRSNLRGTVAFAMLTEPDTRTTQLYVNLADNTRLDAEGFAPVAQVVEGMEIVDGFYAGYDEGAGGGMRGGNQGRIVAEGNAHLDAEYPRLSRILEARIEPGRVLRFPDPGANRIRVEEHLLPAVSSGPMDPSWSPDGERLAFSMAGDIWVVAASGGEAVAVTAGPAYHFEPAWSPDGTRIALARELDGNLDVGIVDDAGGPVRLLTSDPHIDVEPSWAPDGAGLYFASARSGGFDIYYVAAGEEEEPAARPVLTGPGHQIQPAVSPDGRWLAFVSPVRGRLGTGGLWTVELPATGGGASIDAATLVHYEETSYRAEPAWTADGAVLVYVSDVAGSNDLAALPAAGGSPARLTEDAADEYDPAPSPDGARVAFVSNRGGSTRLFVAPAGGGRRWGWSEVVVATRRRAVESGELLVRVEDGAAPAGGDGRRPALPARIQVVASDERAYAPAGVFHRTASATDQHYFHVDGEVRLMVPAGDVQVEALHGFEYRPELAVATVSPGRTTEVVLTLARAFDAPAHGWISGDTHAHDLHQGRWALSHEDFFRQLVAEDIRVTNALIHMDGTRIMGRWDDLTGEPHPLSTPGHVLQYAQEFRGSFGHVGLLGISEFVTPLIGGTPATAFAADVLNLAYLDAAHAQGGIGGYMHPYSSPVERPEDGAFSEIALDVALGAGDFYDVANLPYDDRINAAMYHRFLNAGFRLPATGGTDSFTDVWRDAPPGTSRTYARMEGPPAVAPWLAAVKAGRTFATNGPLLLLHVSGAGRQAGPGEELALERDDPSTLEVELTVASIAPLERIEVLVNGRVARSIDARARPESFVVRETVEVPGSAWIAAMAVGPAARNVAEAYPFAHTTPVYVTRGGRSWADPQAARFLADMVRAQWQRVAARDRFATPDDEERYRLAAERAIAVYEAIAAAGQER